MKTLVKVSDVANWIVIRFLAVLVIGLFGINLAGIVFRYFLGNPQPWPVPISRIFLVWTALLGISVALKEGEHVAIEGAVRALPSKYGKVVTYFSFLIIGIWSAVIFWQGWIIASEADQMMMISDKIQIKFFWRLLAVPISGALQFIHILACPKLVENKMEERR